MVSLYLLILWDEGDVEVIGRPSLGFAAKVPDDIMVNVVMVMIIMIAMIVMIIMIVMMVIIVMVVIILRIMVIMMIVMMVGMVSIMMIVWVAYIDDDEDGWWNYPWAPDSNVLPPCIYL